MKKLTQQKQTISKRIHAYFNNYAKWLGLPLGLICLSLLSLLLIIITYQDKIFPRIQINKISMGGLTKDQAVTYLNDLTTDYTQNAKLDLVLPDDLKVATESAQKVFKTLDLNLVNLTFNNQQTVNDAFEFGRSGDFTKKLNDIKKLVSSPQNFELNFRLDTGELEIFIDDISQALDKPGAKPSIILDQQTNQIVEVVSGEDGVVVDRSQLISSINDRAKSLSNQPIILKARVESNQISETQAQVTKLRAQNLLSKTLDLHLTDVSTDTKLDWSITGNELVGFLDFNGGFDRDQIESYIKSLSESINRPPQNATFQITNGRVEEFVPAIDGISLDVTKTSQAMVNALSNLEQKSVEEKSQSLELISVNTPAEIKTEDVNDLGIKQLLGRGESNYRGSIAGRVFNVAHTASKLHGVLIAPGETFSFVKTVGEISAATGYKTAYVIQNGRTVLGDGGGVCQDSTTLFRAIMDAGLPITERKAHSYRVGYYEQNSQPGFDATIYHPTVDLKFTNDTPGHILIQAHADSANTKLVIELYGTSDGRISEISNYRQWDAVPAPPPLYQDDPTLQPGEVKQVDWAAPGLKVKFDYTVTRNDEIIFNQTYYSNYRPWQAVYLKGV